MEFILNDIRLSTSLPNGMTLLDYVRYQKHLPGTKIGCREGDCGACTILIGELIDGELSYKTMTSCIMPIGNVEGKHVVTIEGINMESLNPVQEALNEAGATQCGFCTVGFVMSLMAFCLSSKKTTYENGIAAIDGNICRCTGYKSIKRAVQVISSDLKNRNEAEGINWLVRNGYIPKCFLEVKNQLRSLSSVQTGNKTNTDAKFVAGGTDLYVQRADELSESKVRLNNDGISSDIVANNGICQIGRATTVTDLFESELLNNRIPRLRHFLKLVSSTQIRNMATVAGNIVNASPIGDLTIFLLALEARLILESQGGARETPLKEFYKGYKKMDLHASEVIGMIEFDLLNDGSHFNFEKVSKRKYLDIASVNSAISIKLEDKGIREVHLSAGGVSPIPLYLKGACEFLKDKELNVRNVMDGATVVNDEISPISDARGTADYKRLLLRQLYYAHFIELFPNQFQMEKFAVKQGE